MKARAIFKTVEFIALIGSVVLCWFMGEVSLIGGGIIVGVYLLINMLGLANRSLGGGGVSDPTGKSVGGGGVSDPTG